MDPLALLGSMLDLVGKRLLESLFQERAAARFGSRTPLASWLTQHSNRQSHLFVEEEREAKNGPHIILDLVQEAKSKLEAEGRCKRISVTLNEANEVVRRLAATKSGDDAEDDRKSDTETALDEVEAWLGSAQPTMHWINARDSAERSRNTNLGLVR